MNHPLVIKPEQLLSILKTIGLEVTVQSGGRFTGALSFLSFVQEGKTSTLLTSNGPITVIPANVFLETVFKTEANLNLKLFV